MKCTFDVKIKELELLATAVRTRLGDGKKATEALKLIAQEIALLQGAKNNAMRSMKPLVAMPEVATKKPGVRHAQAQEASSRFTRDERERYAMPLIKAIRKATGVKFAREDVTYIQIARALYDNMLQILNGEARMPSVSEAERNKVLASYDVMANTILVPANENGVGDIQQAVDSAMRNIARDAGDTALVSVLKKSQKAAEVQKLVDGLNTQRQYNIRHGVDKLTRETVLHELVHAITETALRTEEGKLTKEGKALEQIRAAVTPLLMRNERLAKEDTYWQTDLYEFVSEAISNPELVRELSRMPVSDKKSVKSVLEAIVRILAGVFGKHEATVHDAIMYQLGVIADKQKQAEELVTMLQEGSSTLMANVKGNKAIIREETLEILSKEKC